MNKFSERLKELRQEKGLSQQQLAINLKGKISRTAIAQWELGTRIIKSDSLIILADFFGVTTDYLLGRTDY